MTNNIGVNRLFEIYQLNDSPQAVQMKFMPMAHVVNARRKVNISNYNFVYRDEMKPDETLEDIYERFNLSCPEDFYGHSLSVSDIVVVHSGEDKTAYFVDSVGFAEVPYFFNKTWRLPVTWSVCDFVNIEAETLEDAIDYFRYNKNDIELPQYPEYVEDSFCLSDDAIDIIAAYN